MAVVENGNLEFPFRRTMLACFDRSKRIMIIAIMPAGKRKADKTRSRSVHFSGKGRKMEIIITKQKTITSFGE